MIFEPYPTLALLERRWRESLATAKSPRDVPTRIECSPEELDKATRELDAWAKANRPECPYVITKKDGAPMFLGCGLYAVTKTTSPGG